MKNYIPPNHQYWQGRADLPSDACFFQRVQLLDLTKDIPTITHPIAFGLIGFCCDEGIKRNLGRTGAANGPAVIREILAELPFQREEAHCYDAGDITCVDQDLESAQLALADAISILLKNHITPIVLGGGHELAWGHYQGIAKFIQNDSLGIINFDAHFDMRPLLPNHLGSSGTPFLQIAKAHENLNKKFDYNCIGIQPAGNIQLLFDTAKKYGAKMMLAEEIHAGLINQSQDFINRVIDANKHIYLSICLDVFAAPFAPGVSAPQVLGLIPAQIMPLIRQLASSGKVMSYDLAELSPKYDIDSRTAKLAANIIYEIIGHHHAHHQGTTRHNTHR